MADATQRPRLVMAILMLCGLGARTLGLLFLQGDSQPLIAAGTMVGSEVIFSGTIPILDSIVCRALKQGEDFGHQRLFGAISWGLAAPSSGFVYNYVSMKWGLILTWVLLLPVAALLFFAGEREGKDAAGGKGASAKMSFWEAVRSTRLKWQQVCFLSCALFSGFCNSSIGTFLFLHIQDMGGDSRMMGLSVLFMILSEVPFMYFSNRLAARIGTFTCVQMALVAYTLRLFGYQALGTWISPWFILMIEPLHGITFGIFYSVCVSYIANGIANERTKSTWQGIFTGLLACGRAAGSIGGGYMYVAGGGVFLFRVGCAILAGATLLFIAVVVTDRGFIPLEPGLELKEEALQLELIEVFSADEEESEEEEDDFK